MTNIKYFVLTIAAACLFAACPAPGGDTPANNSNTNENATETTAAAPTKEALMTLEKSAYEAWKTKDAKFWDTFLADNFVGYGQAGKLDKASATTEYTGAECDVKSYELSDDNMTALGPDAAFITYKTTVDGTCGGQKLPANSYAVGVYVRDGDTWKGTFHAEAPVVDPKTPAAAPAAAPAKPAEAGAAPAEAKKEEVKPADAKPDAATDALFAVETKAWEAWKAGDAKGLEEFAGKDMMSLSQTDGWTARDVTLKRWAGPCEIKSVSLTDPASVAIGTDYALLTFKSAVDGKCGGQDVGPEWGATIYAKEDGVWKAVMTFGTPVS